MPDAREPPDEEIVRRVLAGDEAAATTLFERHLPALRASVRRRLPSVLRGKVGESDVIQETYVAAFLALPEFEDRGDGSFGKWLGGILRHKIEYEVRRHAGTAKRDARREERLGTAAESRTPRGAQSTPSQEAMAVEKASALRAVVDDLPDDYAMVIRCVHLEGLTLAQTGERMGRSPDAIRKLYGRALERLAERLRGRDTMTS